MKPRFLIKQRNFNDYSKKKATKIFQSFWLPILMDDRYEWNINRHTLTSERTVYSYVTCINTYWYALKFCCVEANWAKEKNVALQQVPWLATKHTSTGLKMPLKRTRVKTPWWLSGEGDSDVISLLQHPQFHPEIILLSLDFHMSPLCPHGFPLIS